MKSKIFLPFVGRRSFSSSRFPQKESDPRPSCLAVENGLTEQHEFHHTPLTYYREVLSCALKPALISNETLNVDARMRAKQILDEIVSVGSYSESLGIASIRDNVCKFVARMDGVSEPSRDEVILTEGAERAIHLVIRGLITRERDAILVPAPHYPLYPQTIKLNGGSIGYYQLDKHQGWEIDIDGLERLYEDLRIANKVPKAIVIINPGNPTGHTTSVKNLAKVLEFSVSHRLLVIADQVFRENISRDTTTFRSCRSVLDTLSPFMRDNCEIASIHSVSKGLTMTPGLRGGYLYLHNISPFIMHQLGKFQTAFGCSNIIGQLMIDLMVNPFEGMSQATKFSFETEYQSLRQFISKRGRLMSEALADMENLRCQYPEGGMHLYPEVQFSARAIAAANEQGKPIDRFYCQQMQQNTGTALIPGTTFGQPQHSHHFRISPCILPDKQLLIFLGKLRKANLEFHQKFTH